MVRHVDYVAMKMDSGAVAAENVWEYVNDLVKSYKIEELMPACWQVRRFICLVEKERGGGAVSCKDHLIRIEGSFFRSV